jgi:hypothetical protein
MHLSAQLHAPAALTPTEGLGMMNPKAGLHVVAKRKILPLPGIEHRLCRT